MQYSIMTFASLAAMASVAFLSVPSQAKAYDYGHGHGHIGHRYGHGHGHFGHRYGHGYRFGGHEYGRRNRGWVRINLEPRESRNEAQVLVDGAHAGAVGRWCMNRRSDAINGPGPRDVRGRWATISV